jgi:hypothetical protein
MYVDGALVPVTMYVIFFKLSCVDIAKFSAAYILNIPLSREVPSLFVVCWVNEEASSVCLLLVG